MPLIWPVSPAVPYAPEELWPRTARGYVRVVEPTVCRGIDIAADPETVWALITDLPRMGDFSPENRGGRWLRGAAGPAIGARFRGVNRNGLRRWYTTVQVIECLPGRRFTFDVRTPFGVRVSRWTYHLEATPAGCHLTERWYWTGVWFMRRVFGPSVTGRGDRAAFSALSIERTLAAVKQTAERDGGRQRSAV
jgi:hypothetical protein